MKKIVLIVLPIIFIGLITYFFANKVKPATQKDALNLVTQTPTKAPLPVDIKASFAIFTNNTFRVFTAKMYHNLSTDTYIEASNPNIIIVKKFGITYDDFFKTLPFSLSKDCLTTGTGQTFCTNKTQSLRFFLNGNEDKNALSQPIIQGDKLLITYGNKNANVDTQLERIANP